MRSRGRKFPGYVFMPSLQASPGATKRTWLLARDVKPATVISAESKLYLKPRPSSLWQPVLAATRHAKQRPNVSHATPGQPTSFLGSSSRAERSVYRYATAVEFRITNRGCILRTPGPLLSPLIMSSRVLVACEPISYFGTNTVVNAGFIRSRNRMSS